MSNIIILILTIFSTTFGVFSQPEVGQPGNYHAKERIDLQQAIEAIKSHPESAHLLATVEEEGPIFFELIDIEGFDFGAMWDASERRIAVNARRCKNQGELISSLIFELHNAKTNRHLMHLSTEAAQGNLGKNEYVYGVEKMEHGNALETGQLLENGVKEKRFPPTARWSVLKDFDEHYAFQQATGHSQWIAANYDMMRPLSGEVFEGTIPNLPSLSDEDLKCIAYYISLKNKIDRGTTVEQKKANDILAQEIDTVVEETLFSGGDCNKQKHLLLVFKDNTSIQHRITEVHFTLVMNGL